jgi:hypothetical protein
VLEERANRGQERKPAQSEAILERVSSDLPLEDQRRVLHSAFYSVFVWRTSYSGRQRQAAESPRELVYPLSVTDRLSRSETSEERSAPFRATVQSRPTHPENRSAVHLSHSGTGWCAEA